MTNLTADVCRVTVVAADRRIDLAVPATVTVSELMPTLVATMEAAEGDGWVLQRIGGAPFDPSGTPESLDWLEGEELHLRPVDDPLPELDFDDLADGIATAVNRRADRWQPEYRRPLFLALTVVALIAFGYVLIGSGQTVITAVAGFAVGGALLLATVLVARLAGDGALAAVFGAGGTGLAGLTAAGLAGEASALGVGVGSSLGVLVVLLVCQRLWARSLPYPPFLIAAVLAAAALTMLALRTQMSLSRPAVAGLLATAGFALVVFSPKAALRLARLRGVQLPRSGEELRYDSEPQPADELEAKTAGADGYLTIAVLSVCLLMPYLQHEIMRAGGWIGWLLVAVLAGALALRARSFFGVWQRIGLVVAATTGFGLVAAHFSDGAGALGRTALLLALAVLLGVLVLAAARPWPRRLLPIWEFLAGAGDVITGVALVPLLLQVLGVYAWARGLLG